MRVISAADIDACLDFPGLIDTLAKAFSGGVLAPPRHHHEIARAGAAPATHLLMPAYTAGAPGPGAFLGTKIVNVFPDNGRLGLPAVLGAYLLQSGETGAPLAVMDGTRLTHWRTAAASALAARFLAPPGARRLLMVGAGALASFVIRAHASVRPVREVAIWNHRQEGAARLAAALAAEGFAARAVDDLEAAAGEADIISCATLSTVPLLRGDWLRPGQHIDLIGAFNLKMREADDAAVQRARVFIDTPAALSEGGDVALAIRSGAVSAAHVEANLLQLCKGEVKFVRKADDITLFKSVGASVEDLAAAMLVWQRVDRASPDAQVQEAHQAMRGPAHQAMRGPRDPKGWHARGYLPHFDSPETVQHLVFRVPNSIPADWLATAPQEPARRRTAVDKYLDRGLGGTLLADPQNAASVHDALRYFDGERYRLLAWCVMPNHVHAVIEQIAGFNVGAIVKSWKAASTRAINARTGASGAVWAADYFDRYMRNEEQLEKTVAYVENNPVNAGLCAAPADWAWSSARHRG